MVRSEVTEAEFNTSLLLGEVVGAAIKKVLTEADNPENWYIKEIDENLSLLVIGSGKTFHIKDTLCAQMLFGLLSWAWYSLRTEERPPSNMMN